jgi:hypothetical protein
MNVGHGTRVSTDSVFNVDGGGPLPSRIHPDEMNGHQCPAKRCDRPLAYGEELQVVVTISTGEFCTGMACDGNRRRIKPHGPPSHAKSFLA